MRWVVLPLVLVSCAGDAGDGRSCTPDELVCQYTLGQVPGGAHKACYCPKPEDENGTIACQAVTPCPAGQECLRELGKKDGVCAVPRDATDFRRRALSIGFETSLVDFDDRSDPEQPDLLVWRPGGATKHIVCALFACMPEIDRSHRIANFDRCVLSRYEFDASRVSWTLDDATRGRWTEHECHADEGEVHTCGCDTWLRPTRLLRGCWAYDDHQLTHASPLVLLDHEAILALDPPPRMAWVPTCATDTEGMPCHAVDSEDRFFGVCKDRLCVDPRLVEPECL